MLACLRAGQRNGRQADDAGTFMAWGIPWLLLLARGFSLTVKQMPLPYFQRADENSGPIFSR